VFTGVVDYERYGLPDMGVCTRDMRTVIYGQVRRAFEVPFAG
jgi:hypothetical protein